MTPGLAYTVWPRRKCGIAAQTNRTTRSFEWRLLKMSITHLCSMKFRMSRGVHNLTNGTELSSRGMRNTAEYDNFLLFDRRNRAWLCRAKKAVGNFRIVGNSLGTRNKPPNTESPRIRHVFGIEQYETYNCAEYIRFC